MAALIALFGALGITAHASVLDAGRSVQTTDRESANDARARRLCARAMSGRVVASTAATVGDIRRWRAGPPGPPPLRRFFPGSGARFAAWCWVNSKKGRYAGQDADDVYAVGPRGSSHYVGSVVGTGPQGGPPPIT